MCLKRAVLSLLFIPLVSCSHTGSQNKIDKMYTISGRLLAKDGKALANGVVRLKGKKFKDIYEVRTDKNGAFKMRAKEGRYTALYVVKDYLKEYLEFWHWDILLNRNIKRDIRIDTLELYGVKAWKTFAGLMIYVRPMSLKKYKRLKPKGPNDPVAKGKSVFPYLTKKSVKVFVDENPVTIRKIEKIHEVLSSDGSSIEGIIINTSFPKSLKNSDTSIFEVCVEASDERENEFGMACQDMVNLPWNF